MIMFLNFPFGGYSRKIDQLEATSCASAREKELKQKTPCQIESQNVMFSIYPLFRKKKNTKELECCII